MFNPGTSNKNRLIDPALLFKFSISMLRAEVDPLSDTWSLPEAYTLPRLDQLSGTKSFGELRGAWNKKGLVFQLTVTGKQQYPWCRQSRMDESDGLYLWLDTRNSPGIQRATRFCHLFVFAPMGGGPKQDRPIGALMTIARAKENPHEVAGGMIHLRSKIARNGYQLRIGISCIALTGFDPIEYPRLGFHYAIADRELGWQALTVGRDLPAEENPSLWSELELRDEIPAGSAVTPPA
jgi:hypothetical protein